MYDHNYLKNDLQISENEKRTFWVIILTLVTMVIEITAGYLTSSMALLADGWHMATHAGALGITFAVYRMAKSDKLSTMFSFGTGKFIPLGGYTSALLLGIVAIMMMIESSVRLFNPLDIHFSEAIFVAVLGLVVNIASALLLSHGRDHHGHQHDHNIKGAYFHVLADALTSVFAIIALVIGRLYGHTWPDAAIGIVGGLVILKWAIGLAKEASWELLDGHSKEINSKEIEEYISKNWGQILDLHIWKIAPQVHSCSLILKTTKRRDNDIYRKTLLKEFGIEHCTIEEIL